MTWHKGLDPVARQSGLTPSELHIASRFASLPAYHRLNRSSPLSLENTCFHVCFERTSAGIDGR